MCLLSLERTKNVSLYIRLTSKLKCIHRYLKETPAFKYISLWPFNLSAKQMRNGKAKKVKSKLQLAVSTLGNHVTRGPTCRSPKINNDQNSTTKNTTLRRHITDLLGGVRAKPLFRDSTTIPAWNDKTETATIAKQLRVAISNKRTYQSLPSSGSTWCKTSLLCPEL